MRQYILFTFFVITGFVPIYPFIGWIYVFNANPNLSQVEKQQVFNETITFGFDATGSFYFKLLVILLGSSSVVYFGYRLSKAKTEKSKKNIHNFVLCLTLLILFSLFTLQSVFAIL